ncbi:MAG: hypothetical protein IJV65_06015 [Kiritimatiellae bacterium]|nr:hypothetical protein [Kiritimatiellia bacterium]
MNENENTAPGAATPPPETPAGAAPDSSRSAVFSAIRSIFGHGPADAESPAPRAPAEPPARVLVRNCSTRRVLAMLLQQFGGDASVSGRYFAPDERDVAKIRAWAAANGLFVKESRVLDTLVLDLMMDRTKLERGPRPYGRPRFGGRFGDGDDAPDSF